MKMRPLYLLLIILSGIHFFSMEKSYAQKKMSVHLQHKTLNDVLLTVQKNGRYYLYIDPSINTEKRISISTQYTDPVAFLQQIDNSLSYEIIDNTLVVTPQKDNAGRLFGLVLDENEQPVSGVVVHCGNGKKNGAALTDSDGRFSLPAGTVNTTLTATFIGYKKQNIEVGKKKFFCIHLEADVNELDDVIVTGYAPKAKNSFTGTAVQVKGEELRTINNTSFFDALKVFDPSFKTVDSRELFGSDPNHVPSQIEIRGQNSFPDISENNLRTETSLPVFILDGFEVNVEKVYDLDMNRIQSVTILKDASASAIYGSRAANGVIVIETRSPEAGKLQINYSLTSGVQVPDLSSYNLMNAAEALEFQKAAGVFNATNEGEDPGTRLNSYNVIRQEIMSGTDTYWLSKPLRVGFQHKHSLLIDGSVNNEKAEKEEFGNIRYSVNLAFGQNNGVMKGSGRTTYEAGTKLLYNSKKLYITNDLQFSMVNSDESPYGDFSSYTQALPYHREKDADGKYYRTLSLANVAPEGMSLSILAQQESPVYEAKYLNSFTEKENYNVTNNTSINWEVFSDLRVRANFSVSYDFNRTDGFISPQSFSYINSDDNTSTTPSVLYNRGKYTLSNNSSLSYKGNIVVSYSHSFGVHDIQAIWGGEVSQNEYNSDGYTLTGFLGDALNYLSYGVQYELYGRPSGSESMVRAAGTFANINYSYHNRYLVDLTGRIDGSSIYGKNQQTAPYWSVGFRWNMHNESFLKGNDMLQKLALRLNVGTTGNQNFSKSQATSLYTFLTSVYGGYFGALVSTLGNPDLKGQLTYNRNIGIEGTLFGNKFNFDINYYYNTTEGNLTDITIAPSIGFDSYKTNMGDLTNQGFEFSFSYTPIRTRDITLNFMLNGAHNTNRITSISETLRKYNEQISKDAEKGTANVFLFKEGESMNTIYAVRSLGIDPGTGKEIFLTKEGEKTFTWSADDQVPVGVNEPILQGYIGGNFRYKVWEIGTTFNYSFGADRYNYTLHEKIENVDYMVNNDRRALTERWKQPGDVARYKAISDNSVTQSTSRFVQRERMLSLTSLRISYTLPQSILRGRKLSMVKLSVTGNEIFYCSTIRQERGLTYPYARSINFSAYINF